jgi:hypothetical protein
MVALRAIKRKWTVCASAAAVLVATFAVASPASAAGGEQGELLIRSIGTAYANGPVSAPAERVTTAGTAVTFSVEVLNTGSSTAQFLLRLSPGQTSCDPSGCPAPAIALTQGSLNVTASASGANGYYTPPIAPDKLAVLSLKVTPPRTAVPDNAYFELLELDDTAGSRLGTAVADTSIKDSTGTNSYDQYFNAAGQQPLAAPAGTFSNSVIGMSQAEPLGGTATFTVRLRNDSTTPTEIQYGFLDQTQCNADFHIVAKVGTTDVTNAVENGTYFTPMLAHGGQTTITITVKYVSPAKACTRLGYNYWATASATGNGEGDALLAVPLAD